MAAFMSPPNTDYRPRAVQLKCEAAESIRMSCRASDGPEFWVIPVAEMPEQTATVEDGAIPIPP